MECGNWQRIFWKLLTNPSIEVVAALLLVAVATFLLVEAGPQADPLGLPLFARQ